MYNIFPFHSKHRHGQSYKLVMKVSFIGNAATVLVCKRHQQEYQEQDHGIMSSMCSSLY